MESNLRLVDIVREHFPQAEIVARARNVNHLYELQRRGVNLVERELFESALLSGRRVLEVLGVRAFEARERADEFRRHNVAMLDAYRREEDEAARRARVKEAREELERQFQIDVEELERREGADWHRE